MKSYMKGTDVAKLIAMLQNLLITSLDDAVSSGVITAEQRQKIVKILIRDAEKLGYIE